MAAQVGGSGCDVHAGGYPEGVWEDEGGALHFDIEAMVRGLGFEPNPDNLRAMERAAREMGAKIGATVEVVVE